MTHVEIHQCLLEFLKGVFPFKETREDEELLAVSEHAMKEYCRHIIQVLIQHEQMIWEMTTETPTNPVIVDSETRHIMEDLAALTSQKIVWHYRQSDISPGTLHKLQVHIYEGVFGILMSPMKIDTV